MYNLFDQTWINQPKFMDVAVWQTTARKIFQHVQNNNISRVNIILHGGEPLLLGKEKTRQLLSDLQTTLDLPGLEVTYSVQTNATLLDQEWIDLFYEAGVSVGVSMDGDEFTHDTNRVDHAGRGSYKQVRSAIELLLATDRGREVFSAVLSVINIESDPLATLHHFLSLGVGRVDFLLPDSNYVTYPSKKSSFDDTRYADWLITLFDEYMRLNDTTLRIRIFNVIIGLLIGYTQSMDSLSTNPIGIVVIEANGDISSLDSLKASVESNLGLNILCDDFTEIHHKPLIELQLSGYAGLCDTCKACPYVKVCGGGYLPHRFSQEAGFNNPSVYCRDLYKLIEHIQGHLIYLKKGLEATAVAD